MTTKIVQTKSLVEKVREKIYYFAKEVSLLRILFFSIFESVNPPDLYRAHYFWFYFFLVGFAVIAILDLAQEISAWRNGTKKFEPTTFFYKTLSCLALIVTPIAFYIFNMDMIFVIPIIAIGFEVIFRVMNFIYYKWWIQSSSEKAIASLSSAELMTEEAWLLNQITKTAELADCININELNDDQRTLLITRAANERAMENISEAIYAGMMAIGITTVYILGLSTGAICFAMPVTLLLCSTIWNVVKNIKSLFPRRDVEENLAPESGTTINHQEIPGDSTTRIITATRILFPDRDNDPLQPDNVLENAPRVPYSASRIFLPRREEEIVDGDSRSIESIQAVAATRPRSLTH